MSSFRSSNVSVGNSRVILIGNRPSNGLCLRRNAEKNDEKDRVEVFHGRKTTHCKKCSLEIISEDFSNAESGSYSVLVIIFSYAYFVNPSFRVIRWFSLSVIFVAVSLVDTVGYMLDCDWLQVLVG